MSKQVLGIDQVKHLQELGLDASKASMHYWVVRDGKYSEETKGYIFDENPSYILLQIQPYDFMSDTAIRRVEDVPTFTLQDILDILPKCIEDKRGDEYCMDIYCSFKKWVVGYYFYDEVIDDTFFRHDNLIDSAYEALCWCIEKGYINTKKED